MISYIHKGKEHTGNVHTGFKDFLYFYDRSLKLWTVYPVDADGNQIDVAEYYQNKQQIQEQYNFTFTTTTL